MLLSKMLRLVAAINSRFKRYISSMHCFCSYYGHSVTLTTLCMYMIIHNVHKLIFCTLACQGSPQDFFNG